jgi:CBS domain-containing protein
VKCSDEHAEEDMNAGELCTREVVIARRDTPIAEAARLMRELHVGSLVVVGDRGAERVPVGILTDRDIVIAVVAKELDPRSLTAGEVMAAELLTVREQDSISDALRLMREKGVRRVPVVTAGGALAGILTLDDLLELAAEELGAFVRAIGREKVREARARR